MSTRAGRSGRGGRGGRGRGRGGSATSSDAQAAPAPAPGAPDTPAMENALELLFGNLPQDLQPRLKVWAQGVEEAHRETTTRLREVAPNPTEQQYNALIELVDDPLWTAQDTARLNEDCAQLEQVINTRGTNTHMQSLWKLTPKFMGCVPISIICPERLLEYGSEHEPIPVGNHFVVHPNWPPRFCDHLRFLVVHPVFNRSPSLLALAIQYAVKCRTNDRRRWPVQDPTGDRYISLLATAFRNGHRQTKIEDIHRDVRQQMEVLPPLCRLLREIERVSIPGQLPEPVEDDGEPFAAYIVTTSDLLNIKKAVDRVATCGMPDYLPADLRFMWTTSANHGHPYPPANRIKEVLLKAYKRQVQEAELRRRRSAQAAQVPPAQAPPAEDTARQLEQATATIAGLQEELRQARLVDPQLMGSDNMASLEERATAAEQRVAQLEQSNAALVQASGQVDARVVELETQLAGKAEKCADAEARASAAEQKLLEQSALVQGQASDQQVNARVAELEKLLAEKAQVEQKCADAEARASAAEQKLDQQVNARVAELEKLLAEKTEELLQSQESVKTIQASHQEMDDQVTELKRQLAEKAQVEQKCTDLAEDLQAHFTAQQYGDVDMELDNDSHGMDGDDMDLGPFEDEADDSLFLSPVEGLYKKAPGQSSMSQMQEMPDYNIVARSLPWVKRDYVD
ncbi:hypothetical protein GE21DRAFT_6767 [Neurospora crassa]|uniref:Uncharacterized protein n=1 Tax=Neurospora crassa (strain ATCC 24698 / 74-OR23-1A / CBS 708.71 / DSM 1257 / FGSC 987) TaxID=367110 RepID=Q7S840_NEUCR|nr:hypothetical protein NCU05175 [Neurospora crassa OR74A]EAA32500.1 hypothetical protein NCU05175 [Neurospora crassa OR74A]KHE79539.1 hypothetical protein GE21DRAFT_6767 [Neurospora crassa]|eukprot:XP_961736.1 hypothetical protein NCU05175 [Neurospora crassa OR74A]